VRKIGACHIDGRVLKVIEEPLFPALKTLVLKLNAIQVNRSDAKMLKTLCTDKGGSERL
jgi:hypothetical protein